MAVAASAVFAFTGITQILLSATVRIATRGSLTSSAEQRYVPHHSAESHTNRLLDAVKRLADETYGDVSAKIPRQQGNSSLPPQKEPRIFFLFMAKNGINERGLWEAFFEKTRSHRWRVLMHCVEHVTCQQSIAWRKSPDPLGVTLVETVPSTYCNDLVSPMVQLLKYAQAESNHNGDKFVFISDTTLPVKPFWKIYQTLTSSTNSDVCIEPRSRWLDLDAKEGGGVATLVKHSQWVVLNKEHASLLVTRWPYVNGEASWSLPVWPQSYNADYEHNDFVSVDREQIASKIRCPDEWAIFATIFGMLSHSQLNSTAFTSHVNIRGLSASSLDLSRGSAAYVGQGTCRTFVTWGAGMVQNCPDLVQRVKHSLDCYPTCSGSHPAAFTYVADDALKALRESNFLFARKFPRGVVSARKFRKVMLSDAS